MYEYTHEKIKIIKNASQCKFKMEKKILKIISIELSKNVLRKFPIYTKT